MFSILARREPATMDIHRKGGALLRCPVKEIPNWDQAIVIRFRPFSIAIQPGRVPPAYFR
jgi:hypothetical protein